MQITDLGHEMLATKPRLINNAFLRHFESFKKFTVENKIVSAEPIDNDSSFENVIKSLAKFQQSPKALKWLKQANNLVGFAVGMKTSSKIINGLSVQEFENSIQTFDQAFSDFNPSKIKMGKLRRELSYDFFKNYSKLKDFDSLELLEYFSDLTND